MQACKSVIHSTSLREQEAKQNPHTGTYMWSSRSQGARCTAPNVRVPGPRQGPARFGGALLVRGTQRCTRSIKSPVHADERGSAWPRGTF